MSNRNVNPKTVARFVSRMSLKISDIEELVNEKYNEILLLEKLKREEEQRIKEILRNERDVRRNRLHPKSNSPHQAKSRSPPRRQFH
jgi:hypothetical protein